MEKGFLYIKLILLLTGINGCLVHGEFLQKLHFELEGREVFFSRNPEIKRIVQKTSSSGKSVAVISTVAEVANDQKDYRYQTWSLFSKGIVEERKEKGKGKPYFEKILIYSNGNMALHWLLARSFENQRLIQQQFFHDRALHKQMLLEGYYRLPELAKLTLYHAVKAQEADRFQLANYKLDLAERLDPLCPWVPVLRLKQMFLKSPPWQWQEGAFWGHISKMIWISTQYDNWTLIVLNASRIFRTGIGLFFLVVLVVLSIRYGGRILHPLAEKFPKAVSLELRMMTAGTLLISLLVAGLGFYLFGLIMIYLVWKHCNKREKGILKVYLAALVILPLYLPLEIALLRHVDGQSPIWLYQTSVHQGWSRDLEHKAATQRMYTEIDRQYGKMASAIQLKKKGDLSGSRAEAELVLNHDENNVKALVNLGNIALLNYRFDEAGVWYERARNLLPSSWEIWFNSSQVALFKGKIALHKQLLDKSGELEPYLLTDFLKHNDEHFNRYPPTRKAMDLMVRPKALITEISSSLETEKIRSLKIQSGIISIPAVWLSLASLGLFILLSLLYGNFSEKRTGRQIFECKSCGKAMCKFCRKGIYCSSCDKILGGVTDNNLKHDLVSGIRKKSAKIPFWTAVGFDIIFPGAWNLLRDHKGGLFLLFLCMLAWAGFWQTGHLIKEYPDFAMGGILSLSLFPLTLIYAISWFRRGKPLLYRIVGAPSKPGRKP